MNNGNNIIWILVDAIGNYSCEDVSSELGDIGRMKFMDSFASEGVDFLNAITSATSTSMSISSLMSGINAYNLSRDFDSFLYDRQQYDTLCEVLKRNDYNVYSISFAIDLRYVFKGIVHHVPRKYWPKKCDPIKAWENVDVDRILDNLLPDLKQPFFLFLHYNGRRDAMIEERLVKAKNKLSNVSEDCKTIWIICSDHGMPKLWREGFVEKKENGKDLFRSHDLFMTDDNIRIPLIFKYPSCPTKEIETMVGSVDIFPTLLDLVGIYEEYLADQRANDLSGFSLLPLINGKMPNYLTERYIRTDTRYIAQANRMTSIRNQNYKYIFNSNSVFGEEELFYDLKNDPSELTNTVHDSRYSVAIEKHKEHFRRSGVEAFIFQEKYLHKKFEEIVSRKLSNKKHSNLKEVLIYVDSLGAFNSFVKQIVEKSFPAVKVKVVSDVDHFKGNGVPPENVLGIYFIDKNKIKRKPKLGSYIANVIYLDLNFDTVYDLRFRISRLFILLKKIYSRRVFYFYSTSAVKKKIARMLEGYQRN